jgi:hypothetical protein
MSFYASSGAGSDDQYPIHTGTWINWSRGRMMGATLTLSRRDGDLLIAFTALFIAFVTTRTWRIFCFALHRIYSAPGSQEGVYHQHQAILRNSTSPESAAYLLLKLFWSNRLSTNRFRPLSAAVVAILCIVTFTIAGGFSSQISTAVGSEVLLKATNCGFLRSVSIFGTKYLTGMAHASQRIDDAANYAQQCYSDIKTGNLNCGRLIKKTLPMNIDLQAPCPFDDSICLSTSGNIRLDTGYVDSHEDLGLNAPDDQRFRWRNILQCAPLVTAGYTRENNTPSGNDTSYHYGSMTTSDGLLDYIYRTESVDSQYAKVLSGKYSSDYGEHLIE